MRCATYCYDGIGSSHRALEAESENKLPISRAVPLVAKVLGITKTEARARLIASWDGEWHHTSKYANKTKFYNAQQLIDEHIRSLPADSVIDMALCQDSDITYTRYCALREHRAASRWSYWAQLGTPERAEKIKKLLERLKEKKVSLKEYIEHRWQSIWAVIEGF